MKLVFKSKSKVILTLYLIPNPNSASLSATQKVSGEETIKSFRMKNGFVIKNYTGTGSQTCHSLPV